MRGLTRDALNLSEPQWQALASIGAIETALAQLDALTDDELAELTPWFARLAPGLRRLVSAAETADGPALDPDVWRMD